MMRAPAVALIGLLFAATAGAQTPSRYIAGTHYAKLPEQAATQSGDRVEVVEFFVYGCPHCHAFDPKVQAWADVLPEDVAFRRVPATFGSAGPVYARIFYTARALDVLDAVHADVFDAIHEQGRRLIERDAIRQFFVAHGVEGDAFDETFGSQAVTDRVKAAKRLMKSYRVTSVPSLGVDGRYWINSRQAGGHQAMLEIADDLIARSRR